MHDLKQTEQIIHGKIPISREMGISLERYDTTGLVIKAPLQNNINHKQTAFGGSLNAVAALSCWTFLYLMLTQIEDSHPQIVIQKSSISYLRPVDTDFEAVCEWPSASKTAVFHKMYHRKKKARIELASRIFSGGKPAVEFNGVFVALKQHHATISAFSQDSVSKQHFVN
jgi:thioesterase domain-containing protein